MANTPFKTQKYTPDIQSVQKFWLETDILMDELADKQPDSRLVALNHDIASIAVQSVRQQIMSDNIPNRLKNEPPR